MGESKSDAVTSTEQSTLIESDPVSGTEHSDTETSMDPGPARSKDQPETRPATEHQDPTTKICSQKKMQLRRRSRIKVNLNLTVSVRWFIIYTLGFEIRVKWNICYNHFVMKWACFAIWPCNRIWFLK